MEASRSGKEYKVLTRNCGMVSDEDIDDEWEEYDQRYDGVGPNEDR